MSNEKVILNDAVETFGYESQVDKLIEEMAELTQALLKLKRKKGFKEIHFGNINEWNNVHEEIADVSIMIRQMKIIFTGELIGDYVDAKMARLADRIKEHKQKHNG